MLVRFLQLLWFGFAALLILVAVSFSAARLLLPLMGDYRAQLENRLETLVQRPVSIQRMDAAWRGFGPTLRLHDLRIHDESGRLTLLAVEAAWLRVDLLSSLRERSLVTSDTSLVGLDLDLVRRPDGRIGLRDLPQPEQGLALQVVMATLHSLGELSLLQTRLRWEDQTGVIPDLELSEVALRLEAEEQGLWAELEVPLPTAYGNRLRASLQVTGEVARPEALHGQLFLQVDGAHLGAWSSLLPRRNLDVWGRLDLRLWARFQAGRFDELALDFGLRDGQVTSFAGGDVSPFIFSKLQSRLLWSRLADGWRLSADDFQLVEQAGPWPAGGWHLEQRALADGGLEWRGEAGHLELGVLTRLLLALPLPPALEDPLQALLPEGRLADLRFDARVRAGELDMLRLRTDFQALHSRPIGPWPGIQGWSGQIDGDLDAGTLRLDIADGGLDPQPLFRTALPVTEGGGELHWRRAGERLSLYSPRFRLANAEVAGEGRWRLDLPARPDVTFLPYLDLQFQVERGQVAHTGRYLPVGIMNPVAVAWLDRALVAGEITSGTVLFHGPLRGFPFDAGQGRFEVRAEVENAVLDYQEGWEPIRDLRARLAFTGAGMEILGHEARIGAARLAEVRAHTPDLRRAGPPLDIRGQADGGLDGMLAFLRASPLGDRYRGLTGDFRLAGPATLQLGLRIPLRKAHGDFGVQGTLRLADNRLLAPAQGLELEAVRGDILFTEASIGSRGLRARLWGTELDVELDTRPAQEGGYHRIRAQGSPALVARLEAWDWPLAARLEGEADWQAELQVHPPQDGESTRVYLELNSDLRGIGVDLPAPLGKAREETRPLRLWRSLKGADDPLWLQYGDALQAVLELEATAEGQRLRRGGIRLGAGAARLPTGERLQLVGRLPQLSLTEWQGLQGAGDAQPWDLPPMEIDLALEELEFQQYLLREIGLRIRQEDAVWVADLSGRGAQGRLYLVTGETGLERLSLDLDHLRIVSQPGATGLREDLQPDPRTLPVLSVQIRELTHNERRLGELRLETRRQAEGMRVESLSLVAEDYRLRVQGEWLVTGPETSASRFELQLEEGDLGALLETFHQERVLESKRANARLVANWPGSPLAFNLDRVEGRLEVDIGSGQLARVDAPAGRMLSILSIHSLQRRLALDFSDVFGKGFSFNSIQGHVSFMAGDAYTQDLLLQSPSAQIAIAGRTGFVTRDYDQLITITPQVSSNLPIAGALAGGPAVGAALFVAERLFGERMNRLARYQYQVTGSWDDPRLERLVPTPAPGPEGEEP